MPRLREPLASNWKHVRVSAVCLLLMVPPLAAQEDCPDDAWRIRRLAAVSGEGRTAVDVDIANNARIVSVSDGGVALTIIGPGSESTGRLEDDGGVLSAPSVVTSETGVTTIVYSRRTRDVPESKREIFIVETLGGSFRIPRNLSRSSGDDHTATVALDRRGEPHVAWARSAGESSEVIYWNPTTDLPVSLSEGDAPALFLDEEDIAHVAYVRGNDVFYMRDPLGELAEPELVTSEPPAPKTAVSIGISPPDTVLISYETAGDLYLAVRDSAGTFLPPRLIAEGDVLDSALSVEDGRVAIVYSQDGDIHYVTGLGAELEAPRPIASTAEAESGPSVAIDGRGGLHLGFIRDGGVYYASNACAPIVEFDADPRSGPDPLTVQFTDLSRGGIGRLQWDFGDGTTSVLPNPVHVYNEAGEYTVGLEVWGVGGISSRKIVEGLVVVQDPLYSFRIPNQQALPGTRELWFPLQAKHVEPIEGFQVLGRYDPAFLRLVRTDLGSTALSANLIQPDFVETRIGETMFEVGVVFELTPPFEGVSLPPGDRNRLIHFVFDVLETAPQGQTTQIELLNDRMLSPIRNMMAVRGTARLPALKSAEVRIRPVGPPFPRLFVRGDFDGDGVVNITDAVAALAFLFQSGTPPACLDAADVNDSGRIAISGIVSLLNFLFGAGPAPEVPYPSPGLDPTDDALGECLAGD